MKHARPRAAVKARVSPTVGDGNGTVPAAAGNGAATAGAKAPAGKLKAGAAAGPVVTPTGPAGSASAAPTDAANKTPHPTTAADAGPRTKKSGFKTIKATAGFVPGPLRPAEQKVHDAQLVLSDVRFALSSARREASRLAEAARRRGAAAGKPGASAAALALANAARAEADAAVGVTARIEPLINVAEAAYETATAEAEAEILAEPGNAGKVGVWVVGEPGYHVVGDEDRRRAAATVAALTRAMEDGHRSGSVDAANADATRREAAPAGPAAREPEVVPTSDDAETSDEGTGATVAKVRSRGAEPEAHEVAGLFPPMTPEEFEALKADVAKNGLRDPITTFAGKVVDGVHRDRACRALGVEPRFAEWDGEGSLVDFVVSKNLHRRHLGESQRAMVAARIANLAEGRPAKTASKEAVSEPEAAARLRVGRSSVQKAKQVLKRGVPGLIGAVDRDAVSVSAAAHVAELDAREQAAVVARGPAAVKDRARQVRRPERAEARGADRSGGDGVDADAGPVDVARTNAAQAGAAEPRGDREWLEALPAWARLRDPAAFAREALAWRSLRALLDQACQEDPDFDATLSVRMFRAHRPQLLAHVARLDHPGRWRVCDACEGSGGGGGPDRCRDCLGDGFEITRRIEP